MQPGTIAVAYLICLLTMTLNKSVLVSAFEALPQGAAILTAFCCWLQPFAITSLTKKAPISKYQCFESLCYNKAQLINL